MPLVTTKEMFEKAYNGGYAIGAFNVNNMEIVQGITEAAAELNAPLILQVSKGARAYANHTYLMKLVEAAVIETGLPIALHLDHGDSFDICKSCIDGGFTSVMIDASSKPFEENIELTKKVVEYAHDHGVVVEAELGTLAGIEDEVKVSAEDSSYTRPEDVQEFVERTGKTGKLSFQGRAEKSGLCKNPSRARGEDRCHRVPHDSNKGCAVACRVQAPDRPHAPDKSTDGAFRLPAVR